jgi:hypothetical protein
MRIVGVAVEDVTEMILAFVAMVCFTALLVRRWKEPGYLPIVTGRLILVDALLAIASLEVFADTFIGMEGVSADLSNVATIISIACRGSLIAGAIALLATFNHTRVTTNVSTGVVTTRSGSHMVETTDRNEEEGGEQE